MLSKSWKIALGSVASAKVIEGLIFSLGFTAHGIVAGSIAAKMMAAAAAASAGGGLAVGSLVAILQSAGVLGLGPLVHRAIQSR